MMITLYDHHYFRKGSIVHKTLLLAKDRFIVVGMQLGFKATPAEWKERLYAGSTHI